MVQAKTTVAQSGAKNIRHWTELEKTKLRRLWGTAPRLQIEKEFPSRSWNSIIHKANALRLFRQRFARIPQYTSTSVILNQIGERMKKRGFTFVDLNVASEVARTDKFFLKKGNPRLRQVEKVIETLRPKLIIVF